MYDLLELNKSASQNSQLAVLNKNLSELTEKDSKWSINVWYWHFKILFQTLQSVEKLPKNFPQSEKSDSKVFMKVDGNKFILSETEKFRKTQRARTSGCFVLSAKSLINLLSYIKVFSVFGQTRQYCLSTTKLIRLTF